MWVTEPSAWAALIFVAGFSSGLVLYHVVARVLERTDRQL